MFRVAFATDDRVSVNQHFGAATGFAIYALDAGRASLVQVVGFPEEAMDGNEHKLDAKIDALSGCAAVYCLAVGGSAVRRLLAGGIQPVRMDGEAAIEPILHQLRAAIRDGGIPWVDKHVNRDMNRFDRMAEEGWQE
ncbi:MAG: NifB/NifX family molybdenum-iron cluster-binding protein [Candidatus Nitricoxidivorans perseverans]|uniref:NifB/NifX family molybdenum-iron cluster-binding protein n=1 Tax=Candidatus Nitricoxidivorans perseverans TaxID=2975601 RepID=A0AA49IYZ0_9PROT|nr:MAG: NifB/NifX family molybdenum-iron cluster-binding protein [Candidatus Nitricoxidivorans perseverans]